MVAIVCMGQIELSPFAKKYIDIFKENGIEYDIIHWNRSGNIGRDSDNVYTLNTQVDRYASNIKKALPFFEFSRFASRIIKRKKYDKLVVLTTQTALFLSPLLLLKYRGKFFFDYRDTSYEYIGLYKWFINKIADAASAVCLSSPGFAQYIKPKKGVVISHNFQYENYVSRELVAKKNNDGKIIIGYIGVLREYDYIKKLVDCFGNDNRFEFHVHGGGDDYLRLKEYSKKYSNITVFGEYKEQQKREILETFDIICYNYPYSFLNYPAIANKFYDGMIMKKPMFANLATFSGKLINDNGLGISINHDDADITNKIFEYYNTFDEKEFSNNCESFLTKVLEDEKVYISKIKEIFID
ncbi:MAG: hypothetical protein PHE51_06795 [Eubacteriales bacterium]|nr:hypothetical protein [Eubacteriales bacterium]